MKYKRITIDQGQMDGVPCIRGIRLPVATIVNMIAQDMSREDILKYYPDLRKEDIEEALLFAAENEKRLTVAFSFVDWHYRNPTFSNPQLFS